MVSTLESSTNCCSINHFKLFVGKLKEKIMELTNHQLLMSLVGFLVALGILGVVGAWFYHKWAD